MAALIDTFLKGNPEDGDYNQYWYSTYSIQQMVEECALVGGRIGFLSTPSVYFSLEDELRNQCFVFDFDKKWDSDRGFVFYDFKDPENVPEELKKTFDLVVIDPPFITHEVWHKYAETAKVLLKSSPLEKDADGNCAAKVIGTTIIENEPMLKECLGLSATAFQPSIPNLVYQYNLFTNYPASTFAKRNPEIPE